MLPRFRTEKYAIWLACERFGILPPGLESRWDDLNNWTQCELIGYSQIREYEDAEKILGNKI